MDDFHHTRHLWLFLDLNGDLQPRPRRRDFEVMRAKLCKIKRGCGRHRLPVAPRRRSPSFLRHFQSIHFSSHAFLAASRVPQFCLGALASRRRVAPKNWPAGRRRSQATKSRGEQKKWIGQKLFFSTRRSCPTIFADEIPRLIWETGFFNHYFSRRPFQATILNTSHL